MNYECAGTVEFLMDVDDRQVLLHRGQSAHPGRAHGDRGGHRHRHRARADPDRRRQDHRPKRPASATQADIQLNGHALQCRITTEDPENNFIPDYGRITAYRSATGFGIRLDGGTAYSGAVITRYYDSPAGQGHRLGADAREAIARMDRALREFRIRGVATNLAFLENLLNHPTFLTNELHHQVHRRDARAVRSSPSAATARTKLLTYIADITVNGHPETKDRPLPARRHQDRHARRPHAASR